MNAEAAIKLLLGVHSQYQDICFGNQDTWYRQVADLIVRLSKIEQAAREFQKAFGAEDRDIDLAGSTYVNLCEALGGDVVDERGQAINDNNRWF